MWAIDVRKPAASPTKAFRCAIYTRKSSEEGLEQDFNSLHAQRESCEAYIKSQRHEGWVVLPTHYNDGGYSGGSMERPGLAKLLADIQSGTVDVVVVYKVDRLTRSLADFAKIVEIFDKAGASFVSVTQQFNTTTSMGRLTLNVLLSFAQFEREVTGERIRDKIAASKQKGMWMGGWVPLGYDRKDRTLTINETEARTADVRLVRSTISVLDVLGSMGPQRISNVAEAIGLDRSTVSRLVAAVVSAGYLQRADDSDDARASIISMTDKGKAARQKLTRAWHEIAMHLVADWSRTDQKEIARLLKVLAERIQLDGRFEPRLLFQQKLEQR